MGLISASPLLERPRRRHLISKIMPQMATALTCAWALSYSSR